MTEFGASPMHGAAIERMRRIGRRQPAMATASGVRVHADPRGTASFL